MTKHLRLLMLALLAIICTGGVKAQTEQPEVTLNFNDATNPWGFPPGYAKDGKTYTYSNDGYTIQVQVTKDGGCMFNNTKKTTYYLQCHSSGIAVTLPAFDFVVSKIELDITEAANSLINNIYVNDKAVSTAIKGKSNLTGVFNIDTNYQKTGTQYTIKNSGAVSRILAIKIYKKTASISTTTTFGADFDGKTFTFTDGVLEGFKAPKATWTPAEVDGSVKYKSSDENIVKVGTDGALSFTKTKFGTATITATFTPTETTKYEASSASYTVVNKEGERIATNIAFAEGIENSTITVKDGEAFEGYKATCTTDGAKGAIQYSSSNIDVATVDETTGAITMGSKYGKTVITAQFIGTDGYANSDKISYTIEYKGDYAFYESFDKCDSQGGNDGSFDKAATTLIKNDKYSDVAGWTGDMYEAKQCVKLGGKKSKGKIMSPVINVNGNNLLTFKAAAWKGDSKNIIVSVNEGVLTYNNTSAQQVEISLDDTKWTDYEMMVSGTTSFRVTFAAATDKSNRFFLDEVMVKEIAAADVTLDEDKDNVVEAAENANVTLKRTLYADGGWNTLCLPFSLTDAQAKAAFGDAVELRTLESVSGNTLTFAKATGITAGVPCLIKVSKADNTYTFTGVTTIAVKDKMDFGSSGKKNNVEFVGIYSPADVSEWATAGKENALFLGAANKFYKAKAGTTMKAFRAFFLVPASTDTQALRAVIDGTITGIDDLNIDTVKADGRVYNLNGQCVGYSLEGLKAGIYIQNGKKVIKK